MSIWLQDLRYGLRMALKTPMVTSIAILSLALGIAANASMFAILGGFFFAPFSYGNQDELVLLRENQVDLPPEYSPGISVANYRDVSEALTGLSGTTLYSLELANLTGLEQPEELQMVIATPSLFEVLQVQPALGRGFTEEEGVQGAGNVLVLHHDYWQSRFLGDPDILGRNLTLDGTAYTVIGVMAEDFEMIPANIHAIRPTNFDDRADERDARGYLAFGRLGPGRTLDQVQAEVAGISARLTEQYPDSNRGWEATVVHARSFFPGPTDTKLFTILTAVTLFGLLIACANVANLLLGRAEIRQKEIAVRKALGAGRSRILRQLLTESVLMGLVAGVVGAVLAVFVVRWIQTAMPPDLPDTFLPRLDAGVLLATMAVSIMAGVVFGLVPALHATKGDLRESLGEGSRGGTAGRKRKRVRNAFVIGEFAIALALLTGSGYLVQAFNAVSDQDPGFESAGLLTFRLSVLEDRYTEPEQIIRYEDELIRTLADIPGVEGVAVMSTLPRGNGNPQARYAIEGRPVVDPSEQPSAGLQVVNPAYFTTLQVPLLRGRLISAEDRSDTPPVAVVSQAWVDREFPEGGAIGAAVEVRGETREVVGVVANMVQERIALAGRNGEAIYLPLAQSPLQTAAFAVRSQGDLATTTAQVRAAVWQVEPDQPVAQMRTLQAHIDESLAGPRSISTFLMVMALIALALAAIGVYGVMAHAVAQQQREIGIRMALGASRGTVVHMVARSGLTLAAIGMFLGIPLAFLMARGVSNALNLFETDGLGTSYVWIVAVALGGVAVISSYLPARRASAVQPVAALKD